MSNFPSTLSTISDPASTDRLNSPSHASVESAQNDAIEKLETFIGTLASAAGTLIYDIRAAASDGGGHVQVANKGGTGQTAYVKGDLLVATSSSVLSKLAVGADGALLIADSAQQAGIKWQPTGLNRIRVLGSVIDIVTTAETSLFSELIAASTLGSVNAIKATVFLSSILVWRESSVILKANFGGNSITQGFTVDPGTSNVDALCSHSGSLANSTSCR